MIRFFCPLGHRLAVPDERAGKKGRCPVCHQKVYVPVANPKSSGLPKRGSDAIQVDSAPPDVVPQSHEPPDFDDILEAELGLGVNPPPPIAAPPAPPARPSSFDDSQSTIQASPTFQYELPPPVSAPPRNPPAPPARFERLALDFDNGAFGRSPARRWMSRVPAGARVESLAISPRQMQLVYALGAALMTVALLCATPAVLQVRKTSLPAWAVVAALLSIVQGLAAVWIMSLADRSTLWIGMLLCVATATVYGAGLGAVLMAPGGRPMLLDLESVRYTAGGWCAAIGFIQAALGYALGQASASWRRDG
ncbi:MAG TPA: hypothetical protein VHV77_00065 [Pirellulales bacterium]|nr:hypothetical protein [Pirellulales bacterium]